MRSRAGLAGIIVLAGILGGCASPELKDSNDALCESIRSDLRQYVRLSEYAIKGEKREMLASRIASVDFDHDGKNDVITVMCPDDLSMVATDRCSLQASSSITGKSYAFDEQRLGVVSYAQEARVVTAAEVENTNREIIDVYNFGPENLHQVCSFDCDRTSRKCRNNGQPVRAASPSVG